MSGQRERPSFLQRRTPLALMVAAALAAVGALLVNWYLPGFLERRDDPEPLRVTVQYDETLYRSCGWSARLPASVDADAEPPSVDPAEVFEWVLDSGGAPISPVDVRVDVEGRREGSVEVVGMAAVVVDRAPELLGPEVFVLCEGEVAALELGFDLDEATPMARQLGEDGQLGAPYFSRASVTVAKDEFVPVFARAVTDADTVSWEVELTIREDGREGTVRPPGDPLVTSGTARLPTQEWWLAQAPPDGRLRWVPLWEVCTRWAEVFTSYDRCSSPLGQQP